jgi:hypothetical protein
LAVTVCCVKSQTDIVVAISVTLCCVKSQTDIVVAISFVAVGSVVGEMPSAAVGTAMKDIVRCAVDIDVDKNIGAIIGPIAGATSDNERPSAVCAARRRIIGPAASDSHL